MITEIPFSWITKHGATQEVCAGFLAEEGVPTVEDIWASHVGSRVKPQFRVWEIWSLRISITIGARLLAYTAAIARCLCKRKRNLIARRSDLSCVSACTGLVMNANTDSIG